MARVVRTLLHVSDLHLGDPDRVTGDAAFDASSFAWWQLSDLFDGYLGHTHVALVRLEELIEDLREEGPVDLIVTGDLTTTGAADQLETALRYIRADLQLAGHSALGLFCPDAEIIPGNHDHWPGRRCTAARFFHCMCGAPGAHFQQSFPALPAVRRLPLTARCSLVIASLDSDADVGPTSSQRGLARGSFVRQCIELAKAIGRRRSDEVRILLAHHSYVRTGITLSMDSGSKRALEALISGCGFQLLLTGHAHTVAISDVQRGGARFRELRCGTTTARDHYSRSWLLARAGTALRLRRLPKNTALIHRIIEDGRRLYWQTTSMSRKSSAEPFTRDQDFPAVQVWR